jgi:hypothetical protein
LSWRAESALERIAFYESGLKGMERVAISQSLNGGDLCSLVHDGESQAGIDASAIHENSARSAGALITAILCPRESKALAEKIQ